MLDISLVVCTRNRAAQLADALPHFARLQSEASWEIVFVDNGSTDASPGLLDAFAKSSGLNIRVVEEPRAGLSVARNAGWRSAGGSVVAFTDDDCYPAPDHVERLRRCFSDADLDYLGGRVLRFDPADCLLSIQPLDRRVDIPPRSFVAPGFILGANLAFRREILERLDGFDEKLGAGRLYGGEDDDIVARASALGITGAYHPGPDRVSSSPALAAGAGETHAGRFRYGARRLLRQDAGESTNAPNLSVARVAEDGREHLAARFRGDGSGAAWCLEVFRWLGSRSRFSVIPR